MARGYIRNVAIGFDQLLNALTGGWPDESLSSRTARYSHRQPFKTLEPIIDAIFYPFQGPNHCKNAMMKEMSRYHFHRDMR
jgi:hypothetical protein